MGYQETYLKMNNKKNFTKMVDFIKSCGSEVFEERCSGPVEIITLNKTIETACGTFRKGQQFIYLVGERYHQRCAENFFEDIENVPQGLIDNSQFIFTEYFPSDDMFENNEVTKICTHAEFPFDDIVTSEMVMQLEKDLEDDYKKEHEMLCPICSGTACNEIPNGTGGLEDCNFYCSCGWEENQTEMGGR